MVTTQMLGDMIWQAVNIVCWFLFLLWFGWANDDRNIGAKAVMFFAMLVFPILVVLIIYIRTGEVTTGLVTDRTAESLALVITIVWGVWTSRQENDSLYWRVARFLDRWFGE